MKWKVIPSFPNYEISDSGIIRKLDGTILKQSRTKQGYAKCGLSKAGRPYTRTIHQFVLEAFHSARPSPKHDCRHLDGNPQNNNLSNLKWGTRQENLDDMKTYGKSFKGSENGFAILTEDKVMKIRMLYFDHGFKMSALSKIFKTSKSNIHMIVSGQTWKHVGRYTANEEKK